MLGKRDNMRYDAIPAVLYTNPELSGVGYTEAAAAAAGLDARTVTLPMRYSGRYVAENEGGDGIFKLVVNNRDNTMTRRAGPLQLLERVHNSGGFLHRAAADLGRHKGNSVPAPDRVRDNTGSRISGIAQGTGQDKAKRKEKIND